MTRVSRHWHSAGFNRWHLFVVTTTATWVRVAYACCNANGKPITTDVPPDADSVAEWNLPPVAVFAWRAQRAYGWTGTADSMSDDGYAKTRRIA